MDAVIGTSKWMVKQATAEVMSRGGGQGVEIATVDGPPTADATSCSGTGGSCGGNSTLEW